MTKTSSAERQKDMELLERLKIAIILGKLGGILDAPEEERQVKEMQVRKCCLHYNKLKEKLGIK